MPAVAGLDVVGATAVIVPGMRHGADDTIFVADRSQLGEMFADPQFRRSAGDGTEGASNLLRRIGLHVEGFQLTGASKQ